MRARSLPVLLVSAAVGSALLLGGVHAESLGAKKYRQAQDKSLTDDQLKSVNASCGTNITAAFDWSTFPDAPDWGGSSPSGYCGTALSAIRNLCSDPTGKSAVQQQVKALTCSTGDKTAIEIKDGKITLVFNKDSTNLEDLVKKYLQGHL
jgi:hypothetical protein